MRLTPATRSRCTKTAQSRLDDVMTKVPGIQLSGMAIMRKSINTVFHAMAFTLCLAALSTSSWAAEESTDDSDDTDKPAQAADKPVPGMLDNGMISLTKMAPPFTRVFDYSGDISNRMTMFGDLNGRRTDWYDNGFSLDMQLTQIYQGVTSGGSITGNGNGAYNGLFEMNAYLDTAKLGWWSGGMLAVGWNAGSNTPVQLGYPVVQRGRQYIAGQHDPAVAGTIRDHDQSDGILPDPGLTQKQVIDSRAN